MKRTEDKSNQSLQKWLTGLATGACNGLFGGGGGMVAVPLLEKLLKMEPPKAHASAISIIFPLSAVTAAVYAVRGSVDWNTLAYVAPALTAGSMLGAKLTGKLKPEKLDGIFTALMFLAGVSMVFA